VNVTYRQLGSFGALGNQLWEIASTVCVADSIGGAAIFPRWGYEPFFHVPLSMFSDSPPAELDLSGNYLQDLNYFYLNGMEDGYIRDPWQDWFGPSEYSQERLQHWFGDIDLSEYTAVHVRRANNLNLPDHHPVQPLEYFERGLDLFPSNKIIVFSDDLDWCRQQDLFKDAIFGVGNDPSIDIYQLTGAAPLTLESVALDFLAMSRCNKFIISNSTFSWWAAFLAETQSVVYPLNWYGPKVNANYKLMVEGLHWTGI
jgi:hypothetical protein